MVSKIPTISFKNISIKPIYKTWFVLGIAIFSVLLISNIWLTLIIALILYIISVFYTIILNYKKQT